MSRSRLPPLFSAALALAGCSGDDSAGARPAGDFPYVKSVPVAGCSVPNACDVLAPACQQGWLAALGCLRGGEPMSVPIRVIDEDAFSAELQANPPEPRPSPDHWEQALTFLGFVQPGAYQPGTLRSERVENQGAYYSFREKDITIVDHGRPSDGISQNSVLLHELVHAAQDQELDLAAFIGERSATTDGTLGTLGLTEGEAELYQTLVLGALNGIHVDELDLPAVLEEKRALMLELALADASPYLASYYTLPYGLGPLYVHQAYAVSGAQGIRALYAAPPASSRSLLLLDLQGQLAPQPAEFFDVSALASEPFLHLWSDAFGALGLWLYGGLESLQSTLELTRALQGDRFDVLESGFDTALVWQLSFGDEASAAAFLAIAGTRPYTAPRQWFDRGGGRLVLVASSFGPLNAELASTLGL